MKIFDEWAPYKTAWKMGMVRNVGCYKTPLDTVLIGLTAEKSKKCININHIESLL